MVDARSVTVRLKAEVGQWKSDMASAGAAASAAAKTTKTSWDSSNSAVGKATATVLKNRQAIETVGHTMLGFGAVAVAGVGLAIKTFSDFDEKMSTLQTLSHATSQQMNMLRSAALTMGQAMGFSASQVADAELELVKAGISVKNIMGGALTGALSLAAAGQINVADATEIASEAMVQFKLKGKDVPHIADLLSAGADKALGGVGELGEALKYSGLQASSFGISIEQTVGTLGAFANAGLLGSHAGTSLRQMLLKLSNPSAEAASTMKDLGINVYDANGKFIGLDGVAGVLKQRLHGLTQQQRNSAMATIFGARAAQGAQILYKQGAKGIDEWTKKVNEQGFAVEQATGKLDNLHGDLGKLKAAFETGLIDSAGDANGALRGLVQGLTKLIHGFDKLPDPLKENALLIAGVGGAALIAGGAFVTFLPRIIDTVGAFKQLSSASPRASRGLKAVGKAAGAAAIAFAAAEAASALLNAHQPDMKVDTVEAMTHALLQLNDAQGKAESSQKLLSGVFQDTNGKALEVGKGLFFATKKISGVGDALKYVTDDGINANRSFEEWNHSIFHATNATSKLEGQLNNMDGSLATLVQSGNTETASKSFKQIAASAKASGVSAADAAHEFPQYKDALLQAANAAGVTNLSQKQLVGWMQGKVPPAIQAAAKAGGKGSDALKKLAGAGDDAKQSLSDVVDELFRLGIKSRSAGQATDDYKSKLHDLTKSIKKNGHTLDNNTVKGRANRQAFRDAAQASQDMTQAMADNGASAHTLQKRLQGSYDELVKQYKGMGKSSKQADILTRRVLGIPKNANIKTFMSNAAKKMADATKKSVDEIPASKSVSVHVHANGVVDVQDAINRIHGKTVTVRTSTEGKTYRFGPNGMAAKADGGIMEFYANGGLRPMAAGTASMVPANTWRVVGDRSDVPEAYIPLDGSKRSMDILMQTVQQMPGMKSVSGAAGASNGGGSATDVGKKIPESVKQVGKDTETGWTKVLDETTTTLGKMSKSSRDTYAAIAKANKGSLTKRQRTSLAVLTSMLDDSNHLSKSMADSVTGHVRSMSAGATSDTKKMSSHVGGELSKMHRDTDHQFKTMSTYGVDQFHALRSGIAAEMGNAPDAVRRPLNSTIGVLNEFASHVNQAFSDVGVKLNKVPGLESGGRVGGGFKTNGPSAIVGEGNQAHPEFVIPTDPKYRKRALGLYGDLGQHFRLMESGGVLDNVNWTGGSLKTQLGGAARTTGNQLVSEYTAQLSGGLAGQLGSGVMSSVVDGLVKQAKSYAADMESAGGVGGAGGAKRWTPVVLQALSMLGLPVSNLGITLRRMNQESGGNPHAINLTDVNAQRGDPSRGLMQTIMGTFRAFHMPGTSNDIYNPLANILASMRYALARYGSLGAAYGRKGGYQNGTPNASAGIHRVADGGGAELVFSGGERVIPSRQTSRLLSSLDGPSSGRMPGLGSSYRAPVDSQLVRHGAARSGADRFIDPYAAAGGSRPVKLVVGDRQMEAFITDVIDDDLSGASRSASLPSKYAGKR